ncbi:PREDICTED: ATP synthase subunit gamma, mitochondrial-like [Papilio polytes]|uniref:ATP synthase subunit gamma, mitochondrial-like n=1 Tax=Papilio polytes TaxID=76194 RepID=UPI0006760FED|nr:PREDICTED: ATP synthase subunit gamma, mitochondrial-like [Papilio polytes]
MVQLKQVSMRLKSIHNIQKITKTMKMVSASKFTKAERELHAARAFGFGPRKFYVSSQLQKEALDKNVKKECDSEPPLPAETKKELSKDFKPRVIYIAVTSDRGLCGGVHTSVARLIKCTLAVRSADSPNHKIVCIGDKSRSQLRQMYGEHIILSIKQIGRISPIFKDASIVAMAITQSGYNYDVAEIFYNQYFTPVKYVTTIVPAYSRKIIELAPKMTAFDDIEEDQLESYAEWTLAALLYYALKQSAASEQSSRMSAMDNATKNANEMIKNLSLLYNRTRQAVITRELIEIISGAAALK